MTTETKTYGVVERNREAMRDRLRMAVRAGLARAYTPPPKLTLSEWADTYRYLSAESAALPGRWKTSNEPMAKGVMDAASDPIVEKVTIMAAAQIMKTELILNLAGFYAHGDPSPMLLVQNSIDEAENFSKQRLDPMIRDTPVLSAIFGSNGKTRDGSDTLRNKAFPGGYIALAGANAPRGLASRPIRVVLLDEIDGYPRDAGRGGGKGEGDPVALAEKRTTTFWNRKIVLASTPTIKGESRIEASYEEGDQRRFHVNCPHCGLLQTFKWKNVKWPKEDPDKALYHCDADLHDPETGEVGCGKPWTEAQRQDAISAAMHRPDHGWIASKPFRGHASFHASQLASKRVPLLRVVREFLEVKDYPDRLKTWVNTVLGETFEVGGERADPKSMFARREEYGPDPLPEGVAVITCGVDVQGNRWESEVVGWGEAEESWSLQYKVHYGDPGSPSFWEALDDHLLQTFQHPLGPTLRIDTSCVDSGYETDKVYAFCRPRFSRRVFAIKGPSNSIGKPIWPKKATRNVAKQVDVFLIGLDDAKTTTQRRLLLQEPGPGYCHFPKREEYDEAYFSGLTIEKRITKYKFGRPYNEWVTPDGGRNEPWDCRIYAFAARRSSPVDAARRLAEWRTHVRVRQASAEPTRVPVPAARPVRRVRNPGVSA